MRAQWICTIWLLTALCVRAAGDDLAGALQKALFEEEANHNLPEAIQAYESVVAQIDKDRKLAATAIFRLGECYRKQGKTNEAKAFYDRILHDFADQPTLTALSRQSLQGLGENVKNSASEKRDLNELNAEIGQLRALPSDKLRVAIQQRYPNPVLTSLMQQLLEAEQDLTSHQQDLGPEHPEIRKTKARLETLNKQIDQQVEATLANLESQQKSLEAGRKPQVAIQGDIPKMGASELEASEDSEVKRIQSIIRNSPDLINAPQKNNQTLLESAAARGDVAVVNLLLDNGALVDGPRQPGLTPLHHAAANGHKAVAELLLRKGAKVDAALLGITPLHVSSLKGYEAVGAVLLSAGASVNAKTSQ